jgi:hypothetical protein
MATTAGHVIQSKSESGVSASGGDIIALKEPSLVW